MQHQSRTVKAVARRRRLEARTVDIQIAIRLQVAKRCTDHPANRLRGPDKIVEVGVAADKYVGIAATSQEARVGAQRRARIPTNLPYHACRIGRSR